MPARSHITLSAVLSVFLATGCLSDAERSNPLDPLAPNFVDEGGVAGRITNRALSGVAGSRVTLSPGRFTSLTSADGSYNIAGVPTGRYTLSVTSEDYATATDTVEVTLGVAVNSDLELNGLPRLESWTINTAHVSRWWPLDDLFQMEMSVQVDDGDGVFDVSRVWMEIPSMAFADTLLVTQTTGLYGRTLPESSLPTPTLHTLLGTPMTLLVRDQLNTVVASPPFQLVRVIDETPEAVEEAFQTDPQDCVVAPLVKWKDVFLPYPFSYRVDVVRLDAGIESLVERVENIPSDSTNVTVSTVPPGDYYWTVAVVDNFKNRSRSKQVGFCITS